MSTLPPSTLPDFITDFVKTASPEQKQCLLTLLNEDIEPITCKNDNTAGTDKADTVATDTQPQVVFTDFVEHVDDLSIDEELSSKNMCRTGQHED